MCGICGIINFDGSPVHEVDIRSMMKLMKHRGPDDDGVFIDGNVGLGFVRLSIIDLTSAGHQPMLSQDKRYIIVFNGEIYNYLELKKLLQAKGYLFTSNSDTEVLLTAYIEWGEECLNFFNGMFSFVIYDRIEHHIFAARDRFGVKPFYYYIDVNKFIFASEIPAITHGCNISRIPNNNIIYTYLAYNRTDFDNQTFFKNILKLIHGHKISFNSKNSNVLPSRWYKLHEKLNSPFKCSEEFIDLLQDSINLRLRSDVPISLCLSGGLDSSTILSILLGKLGRKDISSFSAVYGEGKEGDESEYISLYQTDGIQMNFARPTAESLFNDLGDFIGTQNEPVQSTSIYAQYKVLQLINRKSIKVAITGQGADEQLGGYLYFFGHYFRELLFQLNLFRLIKEASMYYRNHNSFLAFDYFLFYGLPAGIQDKLILKKIKYLNTEFSSEYSNNNPGMMNLYSGIGLRNSFLNHFEYKLEHLLKWDDINSMRFSVETRVPFLDYRLVEKTLSLPSDHIIRNGTTKWIMRQGTEGLLPDKIRNRHSKIGFSTPDNEWLRDFRYRQFLEEIIHSEKFKSRNYIDPVVAEALFLKHMNGKINISRDIWKWINLELWFRKFIDN